MKRLTILLVVLFVLSVSANAQMGSGMMGEQKGEMKQQGMMGEGMPMMPMMSKCQQMMMGQSLMMRDMMQSMVDMMKIQQKMIKGMNSDEKKEMMIEIDKMMGKMDKMITEMRDMPMKCMTGPPPESMKEEQKKESIPNTEPHKH